MMGTVVTLKVYVADAGKGNEAIDKAFARIGEIESLMSLNSENSEVGRINEMAGIEPVKVSDDTLKVIQKGIYYGELSNGLFDISVGPLVQLWGIGTEHPKVPGGSDLEKAISLVDYRDIKVDEKSREIFLGKAGMVVDLGGIAKGYAADEVKKIMVDEGIEYAIINLGGNVLAVGGKYDGGPWNIGIQDPYAPTGSSMGVVRIEDKTVVTSGDYERYFEENGKRYHHILNPKTGYPEENRIKGVTIIASSSFDADALSTTVFLLGVDRGLELVEKLDGVEAIMITHDREVIVSSGIGDTFSIQNNKYKMK
ncbi:MAG: thiamine biosynthesis lipoprotein ApbE [Firmicutes bacterium]|nr:thiamine biosynthesis lipoprotein ApbE [Bacillota bacterium]